MAKKSDKPEQPRFEPEIIPPDRSGRQSSGYPYAYTQYGGARRIYVGRIGPLGMALVALFIALVVVAVFLTVVGAFLIWIPIVLLVAAFAAIYRFLHRVGV
jgi:hypothetical protein